MKLWNIPAWAWATGILLGCTFSLLMFDNVIVGLMFGVSIGTAFAIAFHTGNRRDSSAEDSSPK